MMKTLYLHIGMPKTGTSSIQKFLLQNPEALARQGYCFPKLPHKYPYVYNNRNAHFMVGKLYNDDGTRNKKLENQYLQDGLTNILLCFEQFDNVILSEENIWRMSGGSRKKLFPYLHAHAKEYGYQIRLIVYLRRQDTFQISNWKQNVKHPKTASTLTFEERLNQVLTDEPYVLNYGIRLDQMADLFGKENLIVRRYEPDSWINGSIIDDFLVCVGLNHTDEFIPLQRDINPSLYGNTTEIKRIINKDPTFTLEENAYLGQFLRDLSAESSKRYPCSMLSPEETRSLLSTFEVENARVAREYIGDNKPLFSNQINNMQKWQPDNPYMPEDIIRFFSAVSIDLRRTTEQLCKEKELFRKELSEIRLLAEKQQQELNTLKKKLKHPFRTLWNRIFHHQNKTN